MRVFSVRVHVCVLYVLNIQNTYSNVCTCLTQVSIIASVDRDTYRNTMYEFSNGSNITGLGVQVAAVSL